MTYQTDTNSTFNKKLLQLFILLNDEKEITYESFNEYDELKRPMFTKLMQEYQEMILNLSLKCTLVKERLKDAENETYFSSYIYYQISLYEDYSFSIEGLTDEKKRKYIYVIFYLMLRNNHQISRSVLEGYLKIDISESSFKRLIDSIKELIGYDIYKNKYQSYVIEYDI